jgi:hypothetical protein
VPELPPAGCPSCASGGHDRRVWPLAFVAEEPLSAAHDLAVRSAAARIADPRMTGDFCSCSSGPNVPGHCSRCAECGTTARLAAVCPASETAAGPGHGEVAFQQHAARTSPRGVSLSSVARFPPRDQRFSLNPMVMRAARRDRTSCIRYSREVPQPGRTRAHSGARVRTVTCAHVHGWTCCLLMACKRSGVRIPIAPLSSSRP